MKRHILFYVLFVVACFGCAAKPSKMLVRSDLYGKSLTADDFTIIWENKVIKAFISKDELKASYPKIVGVYEKIWKWSVLDPNPGMGGFANTEYRTPGIRFVCFEQDDTALCGYAGLSKDAFTIRGIGLGDSVKMVLEKYGASYFGNEKKSDIMKDESGMVYRFYNYPATLNDKYPEFDYIQFETKAGLVVGIHLWRRYSDAP